MSKSCKQSITTQDLVVFLRDYASNLNLSIYQKMLLTFLVSRNGMSDYWVNQTQLAKDMGCNVRNVRIWLKGLIDKKLIIFAKIGTENHYKISAEYKDPGSGISDINRTVDPVDNIEKRISDPVYTGSEIRLSGDDTIYKKRNKKRRSISPYNPPYSDFGNQNAQEKMSEEERLSAGQNENNFIVEYVSAGDEQSLRDYAQVSKTIHASNCPLPVNFITSENLYNNPTSLSHEQNNPNYPLIFFSPKFEEFYKIHPNPGSKSKSRRIWQQKNLDAIADDIIANIKYRIDNDASWVRHISQGNNHYIPRSHNYLAEDGWTDDFKTLRELEHAKNNRHNRYPGSTNQTAAERNAALFRWAKEGAGELRL